MKEHDETEHLLSTKLNKERLLEDVFNDENRQGVKELIDARKQETLEEAAERLYPTDYGEKSKNIINMIKQDTFISGAKWQQEKSRQNRLMTDEVGQFQFSKPKMYKEKEVVKILYQFHYDLVNSNFDTKEEWFEQFKKK